MHGLDTLERLNEQAVAEYHEKQRRVRVALVRKGIEPTRVLTALAEGGIRLTARPTRSPTAQA